MEITLDLDLVSAQYEEANVTVDSDGNVSGLLNLTGLVDDEWVAAFDAAGPAGAPWGLEGPHALRFGPIAVREFPAHLATLRSQIVTANQAVEVERHRRAMSAYIDAEERARNRRQALDALGNVFGRRLSAVDSSAEQAA
jgi:hypothetical protein